MHDIRNNMKRIGICFLIIFSMLILYLLNFYFTDSKKIVLNSYNRRLVFAANRIVMGEIRDRNGVVLAESKNEDSSFPRHYPYDNMFSHVVGYNNLTRGRSGGEQYYIQELLGLNNNFISILVQEYLYDNVYGNHVHLTLDYDLQRHSSRALNKTLREFGSNRAALVVMKADTGEILTMISKPDFNPNSVSFDDIDSEGQPFFNRVTQGKYPPGSVYKIIIAAAGLLEDKEGLDDKEFVCDGYIQIEGDILPCISAHGQLDLQRAMEVSCNVAFAEIGIDLGKNKMADAAKIFGFHREFYADGFPIYQSIYPAVRQIDNIELGRNSIGQGRIIVTPLHTAMMVSSVVNQGIMMNPVLVKEVRNYRDRTLKDMKTGSISVPLTEDTADYIRQLMIGVVDNGTGRNARIRGMEVGGKTGSAQNPQGEKTHAWFAGFVKGAEGYIVTAVLIENAGAGGTVAAPLAREVLKKAMELGY